MFNEAKKLVRKPVDDPQVQRLMDKYMKATLQFVGGETMHGFGKLETMELDEIEKIGPSSFTKKSSSG
ncbi:hypothetical protein AM501_13835 [Aneurinibacillus migulanus]|uniref:hypothetical protein n=1 Tax=Aneurinibacillus migulanus TaxID=47500 RepID=UPI0006B5BFD8|nr:hypothetical protein [Aneurinibacillus migulanus]KPD07742.1 hypothetical protein AM501_13835 [Aneurinibacillus migulanus]